MIYLGNSPVGVASMPCGELTKYAEVKVTPTSEGTLIAQHNLGEIPKYVEITCPDSSEAATADGNIRYGIFSQKLGLTEGLYSGQTALMQRIYKPGTGSASEIYTFATDSVSFRYRNSAYKWNTNTEYTVKVYA